ncbi:MAG TPA: lysophospholipid acyltransferase family protein [bacterium]|jgi:1-acyl-sn-glycerol-3-phosphate acyltransferase|nr:lysophospholipid acyltransferase family protein [bacterium]HNT65011.1 lysophospholipid acyltransferase family protein [bacterium]
MSSRLTVFWAVFRSAFLWAAALVFFVPLGLSVILLSLCGDSQKTRSLATWVCKLVVRLAGIRVRVEGEEHLSQVHSAVLVSNHINLFDGFVLYGHVPIPFIGVELDDHFNWPLYGWIIRRLGMIPISRTRPMQAKRSLEQARKTLDNGTSILIMPEGGRTLDGQMKPFKRGPFVLASEAGADIIPMVMIGAFAINRKGSLLIKPGRLILRIGEPLPFPSFSGLAADEIKDSVRQRMLELLQT